VLASVVTGLAFGVMPAMSVTGVSPAAVLVEGPRAGGGRRRRRTSSWLVVVECALAVVLLVGAGLLIRSLARLNDVNPGFRTSGVLSLRLALPRERQLSDAEARAVPNADQMLASEREATLAELLERVVAWPGVEGAGFADDVLMRGEADESIAIPDRPETPAGQLYSSAVSPELFATLGIPLRSGRYLTRADAALKIRALWSPLVDRRLSLREQSRVALAEPVVVNDAFVRRFFPGQNAIGKRFCIDPTGKTYWYEIVGVVGDMHRQSLERQPVPEYFETFLSSSAAELLVRARGDPLALAAPMRRLVDTAIPGTIVLDVTTLDRRMDGLSARRQGRSRDVRAALVLALVLAAIGIYGIVHYAVAERWRELGIRVALGAAPRDVLRDVMGRGLTLPVAGMAVGLLAAAGTSRLLASLLFGVGRIDPITMAATVAVLAAVALIACYLPARRASRVDPIIALRSE